MINRNMTFSILAVDDDPTNINVIISHLKPLNAKMLIATSGDAALEILKSVQPDLIILDINMPNMSGLEVCKQIKSDPLYKHIPVLFLTGSEKDISEAFAVGGVDYIIKPVRSEELIARVNTHLTLSTLVDSLDKANVMLESVNESLEIKVAERTKELVAANSNLRREIDERRRLQDKLTYLSNHDFITRMFNRNSMEMELKNVMESSYEENKKYYFLFIDLDQFKVVNDTCGHIAGDELLRQVADLLRNLFSKEDIIARMGGDEFAVLFNLDSLEHAIRRTSAVKEAVESYRFEWGDEAFKHSLSAALVEIDESIDSVSHLMSIAERTCFESKRKGGSEVSVYNYTKQHIDKTHQQMRIIPLIHHAIEHDQFTLYYQEITPIIEDGTRKIEVLIRLVGSDGKIKPPGQFIPIAEKFHIITEIDKWVIRKAFIAVKELPSHVEVSINLSGDFIAKSSAVDLIKRYLAEYEINPHQVCFEITETSAISNIESTQSLLSSLQPLGFKFALDDFGTGTSSYEYLKELSVDYVKIDGMFVRDIDKDDISQKMVESIAGIAKAKGIKVVAECIETAESLDILRSLNIDYYQGYYSHVPESLVNFRAD
ncbi:MULTISPECIES: EAL domain-containing protein [Alteromonadaceae]|uniref:EAL domain-containing protein n=1 Tax=Brumicola blandensis TaxID=3075611 RepID=A0AAW8QW89_9ALTE|nr:MULTISPECIES: EAL domain-containing protein [unclassified Alteromonas]MDT0581292.1 EAL domain-containing protein [Alteromonas sp. W409]MDT0626920.1 EAL domain-containing protein [Alteromonas sp. W364]